ncbi:MAG TPA: NAD(+) diphosphatase [Solirubrobacteraceae bacterium]|nr:NAD(+) diphosphatase [Solirubrobacteraceae bacterium]
MSAAFTGARLDRAGDGRRRDPAWLAAQRADPRARAIHAGSRGVVLDGDRLALAPLAAEGTPDDGAAEPLLLGIAPDGPRFALDLDAPPPGGSEPAPLIAPGGARGTGASAPAPADGPRPVGLREAVAVLPREEGGLVAYAAALLNWHRRHGFCAACGGPTALAEGGLVRRCPRCGVQHHPRTDPVVIMLVTDGADRVLLGRAPSWPPRRYSALAGFVEPGETLEEAVAREVEEESGVRVRAPRYVASQPWPFPASLMLGFEAPWTGGEPRAQEDEIQDVRWFSRAEVAEAAALDADGWGGTPDAAPGEGLLLPPRLAIARRLLEQWLRRPD